MFKRKTQNAEKQYNYYYNEVEYLLFQKQEYPIKIEYLCEY